MFRIGLGRVSRALFILIAHLSFAGAAQAQEPVKTCRLLSLPEIEAIGFKVPGPLFDDDSNLIKKGAFPGIQSDLRMDQCTSQIGLEAIVPYRLSVASSKGPADKSSWQSMAKALDKDEKATGGTSNETVKFEQTECEYISWPTKRPNTRIHEFSCYGFKGNRMVTLSFNAFDRVNLPAPQKVIPLLNRILSRL